MDYSQVNNLYGVIGKSQILVVDPWTRTPISADIGTFAVPLSTYILIKTHIKGVPSTISEKYTWMRIGLIKNLF